MSAPIVSSGTASNGTSASSGITAMSRSNNTASNKIPGNRSKTRCLEQRHGKHRRSQQDNDVQQIIDYHCGPAELHFRQKYPEPFRVSLRMRSCRSISQATDTRIFRTLSSWFCFYISTSYRGVRCSICITTHDDVQLFHANITHRRVPPLFERR